MSDPRIITKRLFCVFTASLLRLFCVPNVPCRLTSWLTHYPIYVNVQCVSIHAMEPPPRPSFRGESDSSSHSSQAGASQRLPPSPTLATALSRTPSQGLEPEEGISPRTVPSPPSFVSRPQYTASTPDDLLPVEAILPLQIDPPIPHTTVSGRTSPDELIANMPRYQAVSSGSPSNPRTMSQVSPGFIFVNFLSQSVCFLLPHSFLKYLSLVLSFSCLLSHVSFLKSRFAHEVHFGNY